MTKSKLEPIVLIFEDFYLPCDLGHLVITEGLDESQEICGTDDKWPAIIGTVSFHFSVIENYCSREKYEHEAVNPDKSVDNGVENEIGLSKRRSRRLWQTRQKLPEIDKPLHTRRSSY